jgi:hypothetical protein
LADCESKLFIRAKLIRANDIAGAKQQMALIYGEAGARGRRKLAGEFSFRVGSEGEDRAMNKDDAHEDWPLPLSRPLQAAAVPAEGLDVVLQPNAEECAALAQENDLRALTALEARLHVARRGSDGLEVSGHLLAKVRQTCVVTLEDFDAEVDEPVHLCFAPPPAPAKSAGAARRRAVKKSERWKEHVEDEPAPARIVDLEEDAPDPLIGGAIDLGAIVGEFLTLGLDPYPRKPGARFSEPAPGGEEDGPFAALRQGGRKPSQGDGP